MRCTLYIIFLIYSSFTALILKAADITAGFDSADGSSGFSIRDSASSEVFSLDSDGNAVVRGGIRLDAAGAECISSETIIVDSRIGIGTADPAFSLDVIPVSGINAARFGNSYPVYLIAPHATVGFNAYYDSGQWYYGKGGTGYAGLINYDLNQGKMRFYTAAVSGSYGQQVSMQIRMIIDRNGNVGIGTENPACTLEVNGIISGKDVSGTWYADNHGTAAPDYFRWGTQKFNIDSTYIAPASDQLSIEIKKAGYYLICANVLLYNLSDGERGDVYLYRNGGVVNASLGVGGPSQMYYKHEIFQMLSLSAGDLIKVYAATAGTNIYGTGDWSSISVTKLN